MLSKIKSLTFSDSSIIVLLNEKLRKDRILNKARSKLDNCSFSRVIKQHVLHVPLNNGINTILQSTVASAEDRWVI